MSTVSKTKKPVIDRAKVVTELAQAIAQPTKERLPLVFSNRIGSTGAINTTVVSQLWTELNHQERSDLIVEAYRNRGVTDVPIALGLTLDEAISSGLLPYAIVPLWKQSDPVSSEEIHNVMLSEGAAETPQGLVMRFADEKTAQDVYRRLVAKVPGPYWSICHELPRG
jgi:hypothetical protein